MDDTPHTPVTTAAHTPRSAGLYGPRGWTRALGTIDVLGPHLLPGQHGDFQRWEDLDGEAARELLTTLPEGNLADTQNRAPTCRTLLAAAIDHPGRVHLSGYWITEGRWDERVSIDGLTIEAGLLPHALAPAHGRGATDPHGRGIGAWLALAALIGADPADEPDEIELLQAPRTPERWWFWWD